MGATDVLYTVCLYPVPHGLAAVGRKNTSKKQAEKKNAAWSHLSGCAPIARSLGHVLSIFPLIIPRTLQPAEVWGIVLGNVWEEILTRFRKSRLC